MGLVAASLAVASAVHLAGLVHGRGRPFTPYGAGTSEAVICVALLWGASALARGTAAGRMTALATTGFAIAGFGYGLSVTIRGGDLPDIGYHAIVLPILIVTFLLILRTGRPGTGGRPPGDRCAGDAGHAAPGEKAHSV